MVMCNFSLLTGRRKPDLARVRIVCSLFGAWTETAWGGAASGDGEVDTSGAAEDADVGVCCRESATAED